MQMRQLQWLRRLAPDDINIRNDVFVFALNLGAIRGAEIDCKLKVRLEEMGVQ